MLIYLSFTVAPKAVRFSRCGASRGHNDLARERLVPRPQRGDNGFFTVTAKWRATTLNAGPAATIIGLFVEQNREDVTEERKGSG